MFTRIRKTNLATFIGIALFSALSPLFAFYIYLGQAWQETLYIGTGGLLASDFLLYLVEICLVLVFLRAAGGLRLSDVGLTSSLPRALLFTALLWALTQLGIALWQLGASGQIFWNGAWRDPGAAVVAESLYSQLFGNALYEEIVFRGFILVQIYLFMQRRQVRHPFVTTLLTSQLFFALIHVPLQVKGFSRGWLELLPWILATGVAGVIFAALYLKTQNLFIGVGFHALFNTPTQLFAPPTEDSQIPTTIVTLLGLALVFWPVTGRL